MTPTSVETPITRTFKIGEVYFIYIKERGEEPVRYEAVYRDCTVLGSKTLLFFDIIEDLKDGSTNIYPLTFNADYLVYFEPPVDGDQRTFKRVTKAIRKFKKDELYFIFTDEKFKTKLNNYDAVFRGYSLIGGKTFLYFDVIRGKGKKALVFPLTINADYLVYYEPPLEG